MSTTPLDEDAPRPRVALDSGHRACQCNAHTHSLQTTWQAQCGSPNASSRAGLHSGKPWVWLAKRPVDTGDLSTPHAGQRLPASDEQPFQSAQSTPHLFEGDLYQEEQSPDGTQGKDGEEKLVAHASQEPEPEQREACGQRGHVGPQAGVPEGAGSGWNRGHCQRNTSRKVPRIKGQKLPDENSTSFIQPSIINGNKDSQDSSLHF